MQVLPLCACKSPKASDAPSHSSVIGSVVGLWVGLEGVLGLYDGNAVSDAGRLVGSTVGWSVIGVVGAGELTADMLVGVFVGNAVRDGVGAGVGSLDGSAVATARARHLALVYPLAVPTRKSGFVYPSHSVADGGETYFDRPLSNVSPYSQQRPW